MNIKLRLKLKEMKEILIKLWYGLMTPIANAITKYEKNKYNKTKREINQWSDEYAIKRCAKLVVKKLVSCSNVYESKIEFDVAEWCNYDYVNENTIREFIVNQYKDKKLKQWGYERIPMSSVNRVEKLTDLLKIELEKYDMVNCEYTINEYLQCSWRARGYEKTLVVSLKKK